MSSPYLQPIDDPTSRPFRRVRVLLLAGLLLWGCRGEVIHGEPREGGDPLPGWSHTTHYDWGWLNLSGRDKEKPTLGPRPVDMALRTGWGSREVWGRWALAPTAEAQLAVEVEGRYDLCIEARSSGDDRHSTHVLLDGRKVGTLTPLGSEWQVSRFEISDSLGVGIHQLALSSPERSTHSVFLSTRERGLAVRRLGLLPPGPCFEIQGGDDRPSNPAEEIVLERSSTHLVPLRVPADRTEVTLVSRAEASNRKSGREMALKVEALTLDGERSTLAAIRPQRSGTTIDYLTLDLGPYSGRSLVLLFSARLPADGASFTLSDARLHSVGPATAPQPADALTLPSNLPPPIVVLIILDAARADAFSLYGAERPTTPNLEKLAESSYVFDRVTADCPYTLCSSPTILTGLSFLRHGVIDHGLKISEQVTTLTERLAEAGYYTVGATSNPNNSHRTGLDQGFDAYYNTWKHGGPVFSRDPATLHSYIVRGLDATPPDQPLFLMAHYVPPHEPYAPTPEFDLFTDPEYDGVVSRKLKLQQNILRLRVPLDDRDLAQFRALYDGNLRMADHWVGTLLRTLASVGRLDNSIVVLTSDHGEAFREHGRFGHSSTVFEEMMHVPLVVRLPQGWNTPPVDQDRLVALTDITPTLLNLVGVPGADETDGADLFAPADPDRVVYLRSSQPEGTSWGARTRTYKAVVNPEQGSLFDLEVDRLERHEGITESPALFYALLVRLEAAAQSAGKGDQDEDLMSPEEIETLKALGYL